MSLSDIESPSSGVITPELKEDIKRVINSLGITLDRPQWTNSHLSTKSGPVAQAMVGAIPDAHHLPEPLVSQLEVLGGPLLSKRISEVQQGTNLKSWCDHFQIKDKSVIRKLSVIHDPEAKERVIAIFDYWSQTALLGLHEKVMNLLRKIKGD